MPWDHAKAEFEARGMTPLSDPAAFATLWEFRRICRANEIDRE